MNPTPSSPSAAPAEGRIRLDYLDGLRGLAALYVAIHHVGNHVAFERLDHPAARFFRRAFASGQLSVVIFIALSGYCLMLPAVRHGDGTIPGGFLKYLGRRARRILPPYYAAIAACLAMIAVFPVLQSASRFPLPGTWKDALPAFGPWTIASHVFLIHNIRSDWAYRIDPPMWSVATEWQIYLLFPIFLAGRRRLGEWAPIALACAVAAPLWLAARRPGGDYFREICPWLALVFAMGMWAAVVGFSPQPLWRRLEGRLPAMSLALGLGAAAVACSLVLDRRLVADCTMGAAASFLLVACTRRVKDEAPGRGSWALRLLGSRFAIVLGAFSYSLYLMHFPIIALCDGWLRGFGLRETAHYAALLALSVPLVLAASYAFYRAFERPFLLGRSRTLKAVAVAEIASPAP